jgi:hypothetical protein
MMEAKALRKILIAAKAAKWFAVKIDGHLITLMPMETLFLAFACANNFL